MLEATFRTLELSSIWWILDATLDIIYEAFDKSFSSRASIFQAAFDNPEHANLLWATKFV